MAIWRSTCGERFKAPSGRPTRCRLRGPKTAKGREAMTGLALLAKQHKEKNATEHEELDDPDDWGPLMLEPG